MSKKELCLTSTRKIINNKLIDKRQFLCSFDRNPIEILGIAESNESYLFLYKISFSVWYDAAFCVKTWLFHKSTSSLIWQNKWQRHFSSVSSLSGRDLWYPVVKSVKYKSGRHFRGLICVSTLQQKREAIKKRIRSKSRSELKWSLVMTVAWIYDQTEQDCSKGFIISGYYRCEWPVS